MDYFVFITSLYKTCTILAIILVLIRMKWAKRVIQKQKLNKREQIVIAVVFGLLGIFSNYLPLGVYGAAVSTIRVIVISGGILFGPIVGIFSSIAISLHLPFVDIGCDNIIPEILGILVAGIVSSIAYKLFEKYKINNNKKWIVGILSGVLVQEIALQIIFLYIKYITYPISLDGLDLGNVSMSMAIAQIPIGIFVAVVQDITHEKQTANIEQLKLELNKAKLEVLQSQINPHFLFNTLNVIGLLAGTKPEKAREVIVKLSKYIRHNLDLNGEFITIKEELEQIECYIYIQKTRFEDKFDIFYDVEEDIEIKIPSLVLQPLVENALEHGILKSNKKCEIRIKVKKTSKNKVYISVENSGIPISEETIESLYKDNMDKNKIGLRNVHIRLKTIYGQGLNIEKNNNGTKIWFCVGGEYENYNS
ncbi:sensor histidine kinase [Romboutsia sp.]|uniref:sensor histidine kinase n=1 Tax=Romboutsia sp. TaxID=1965302 RepID=UPI003F36574F